SSFSLTQVRVLDELAHRDRPTATALGRDLGLDAGYLSLLLRAFEKRGLVTRTRSPRDGRQSHLALTAHGRKVLATLNARSHDDVAAMLGGLSPAAQARATEAMQTIEQLLGDPPAAPGGAAGAGRRTGVPTGCRMRAVRARSGVPHPHVVDAKRAAGGPAPVRRGRIPGGAEGPQPQLRQGPGLGDLGAEAMTGEY